MKALIYFILFYASIFLISMIPEENVAENSDRNQTEITTRTNQETSYTSYSDSAKGQVFSDVYTK